MKFTVILIATLTISSSWAIKVKKSEEPKDKREAPLGYPSSGHSSQSFQAPSLGHGDASSAISIGAGYSVGGAKPSYSYGADSGAGLQQLEGLQSSGHATIQLAPITLQPNQALGSSDLSQLMSQLSHGLNTGSLSLSPYQSSGEQGSYGGQEFSLPQYAFGAPKLDQYSLSEQPISSVPSYAAGTKGLGSYGSTGPVLFNPSDSHGQGALIYNSPSSGHSFGDAGSAGLSNAGYSLAGLSGHTLGESGHSIGGSGLSLGSSGHSLGGSGLALGGSGHSFGGSGLTLGGSGHSLGGSGHSLGGSGYSLGSSGHSLGGSGHSLGGAGLSLGGSGHSLGGSFKTLGGSYVVPSKGSFKPSQYLGSSSLQSDSTHGLSGLSGSYGAPSFSSSFSGSHGGLSLGSGGHGASFGGSLGSLGGGSSKYPSASYLPSKSEGFGSSLGSVSSFSSGGHSSAPPGTTYGIPSGSYSAAPSATHAASSHSPQYYVMSKYPSSGSFGHGSSSYKSPSSGHGSVSSFSSGPKYSFGGHGPSSRYGAPKDSHGAYSETSYNTIKYSEELKPRVH